ncbi:MAG TPA: hypothetical protein VFX92_00015 [Candidatus Krumholzibacteria bacterium]|nr:hypothetical protein [Candidatus Krumholzibacteria bacterium]
MVVHSVLAAAGLSLVVSLAQATAVGRTEIALRESDVVLSESDPLEIVIRLADAPAFGARVDAAWIELALSVGGEVEGFAPFMVVVDVVLPSGPGGEYEPASPVAAREVVLQPGSGQAVRLDATRIVRHWREAGGVLYARIRVVEPAGSNRPAESIQLSSTSGILGRAVLITR